MPVELPLKAPRRAFFGTETFSYTLPTPYVRTILASHFSVDVHHSALRSQVNPFCGSFGAFLYLLSCRLCCWLSLTEVADALPVPR